MTAWRAERLPDNDECLKSWRLLRRVDGKSDSWKPMGFVDELRGDYGQFRKYRAWSLDASWRGPTRLYWLEAERDLKQWAGYSEEDE